MNYIIALLSHESTIASLGFILGFIWAIKNFKIFIENPISGSLNGILTGFLTSIGAIVVGGLFPRPLVVLYSLILIVSIIYHCNKPKELHRVHHPTDPAEDTGPNDVE